MSQRVKIEVESRRRSVDRVKKRKNVEDPKSRKVEMSKNRKRQTNPQPNMYKIERAQETRMKTKAENLKERTETNV